MSGFSKSFFAEKIEVQNLSAPMRADVFCCKVLKEISRSKLKNGLQEFKINSAEKKLSALVNNGDVIELKWKNPIPKFAEPEKINLNIIYEDENIIALNKKAGTVTHPAAGNWSGTLVNALNYYRCFESKIQDEFSILTKNRIAKIKTAKTKTKNNTAQSQTENADSELYRLGIVHRLDKDTSGVIITARNFKTQKILKAEFKRRNVKKYYCAILDGVPKQKQGKIKTYIFRSEKNRKKFDCSAEIKKGKTAKTALSAYKVLKTNGSSIKIITTLHGTDITLVGLEPSFLPLVKLSIEASDGVTAVSRFLKEKTQTNYHIDKDIEVINNFIDSSLFKPVCNKQFKEHIAPNNEKILVHTSNFRPVKRVGDTIRILDKVKKEIPTKLLLIGDGPDRSDCERLTRELKLEKDVIFLGKQDGLEKLLSVADVFLMPSQSESFGLSALEAMSCGVPVVSSSVGGLPELIVHNKTGYIAEFTDIDRMAKYTLELLKNEKKFNSFSKNSRLRAEKVFEKKLIVPQYIKYYEKILSQ